MKRTTIVGIISVLLSILFLYAAIEKLVVYEKFVRQLLQTPFKNFAHTLAWFVPTMEITIAVLLVFYRTRLAGLYSSFFLMLFFTVYVYYLLAFASALPCGCGGVIEKLGWWGHLYFNAVFTLLAATALLLLPRNNNNKSLATS